MNTRKGTPEDYTNSTAYIEVFGSFELKATEGRRTGIEPHSGKAVYELLNIYRKPVTDVLYVIDDQMLVPVRQYRDAHTPKSPKDLRTEANEDAEYAAGGWGVYGEEVEYRAMQDTSEKQLGVQWHMVRCDVMLAFDGKYYVTYRCYLLADADRIEAE